ncbi:MAG: hypothetical protein ACXVDJ_00980 [Tumebacillaceae bacterium]
MYASLWNQLYQSAHFLFSFLLLMTVVPKYLFKKATTAEMEDPADRRVSRYIRIAFFYILFGYLLVLTNLFEVLAITAILLLLMCKSYLRKTAGDSRRQAVTFFALLFYETLDLGFQLKKKGPQLLARLRGKATALWSTAEARKNLLPRVLLVAVLVIAGYLRFYDAWRSAAPSMSDGYVTLAWMKYLEERILTHHDALFHDGIYPQGFHLTLALLHKFAAIDPLYVLRYTGPLNGLLMTYGLYFAVSRWTGNCFAGVATAALFGFGGYVLLGDDWDRQAATNSQEFAMVFAFPTFFYLTRFLQTGKREDLWTGGAGVAITGLVHTLLFAYVGMGMAVLLAVGVVLHSRAIKRVWQLIQVGVLSVVVALVPFGLGKVLGRDVHGASEKFLESKVVVNPPDLRIWDKAALISLAVVFLLFLISRKPLRERIMYASAFWIITATFVLYEYGAAYTGNEVLAVRTSALWNLTIPFTIGLGLHGVMQLFQKVPGQRWVQAAVCVGVVVMMYTQTHFAPIVTYKMEWESGVEQYLKIAAKMPDKTWMLVTDHTEGYDEVLGSGYHMYIDKLDGKNGAIGLMDYDPALPAFTRNGWTAPDPNVPFDVYIYEEKHVFEVSKSNSIYDKLKDEYADRAKEQAELAKWIATYKQHHNDLQVYFEDANLRIYHIHRTEDEDHKQEQIWGGSK